MTTLPDNKPENINEARIKKLEQLRARGIDPYLNRYKRTHTTQEALDLFKQYEAGANAPQVVSTRNLDSPLANVAGRITARRNMGKISFLDLRDSSGKIQLLMGDLLNANHIQLLKDIDIGDIIGASGRLFRTKTGEPTIAVSDFTLLAKSLQPLPEKWHGLTDTDKRQRQRYLDLIANAEVKEVFRVRSRVISAVIFPGSASGSPPMIARNRRGPSLA